MTAAVAADSIEARVAAADWAAIAGALDARGCAVLNALLTPAECAHLAASYASDTLFRSRVIMARHGFGRGEYQYFRYPLPACVGALRKALYPRLVPIAAGWNAALGHDVDYPPALADYLARCHAVGQRRPTPLLLRYGPDDYNCLHQDLYGAEVFPLQVAILLSAPGMDFAGGEFVLTEQRPRQQSRVEVVPLAQGDAVAFAVHQRPVRGARGVYRVNMRHGVSRIQRGARYTLGVIFHDAA
jgi:hypothetical protein